ncbi:50S ribosomal protein L25 [Candidatus Saccharibacteria bacterium]|nr:MAG: 50S ribosomal protein L25 [Candidatus Saccharibacteria bacterium]
MGDKINLDLQKRDVHGKKVAKLRKEGIIPAIVYGSGIDPISVMAPAPVVEKVCKDAGKHHPVYLKVDGKARIAMIKDIDLDPVKRRVRHVSFHAVKQNETVEAEVPIRLVGVGESAAEKTGLIVLQALDSVLVKAFPANLPDALEVSIADLAEAGDRLTVADLTLPEKVELVDNSANQSTDADEESHSVTELVVASVYEPSALQAANEAAGGDAEPEDVANVESVNGEDTDNTSQNEAASTDHKDTQQK